MIEVRVDTRDMTRWLNDVQKKQIPYATALALTRTAKLVEKDLRQEMSTTFDNPSPYTLKGTFSTSAKKTDLQAVIGLKDKGMRVPPAVLLKEHFGGGLRGHKPMEAAMQAIGALPSGWLAMPGAGMPLDGYGNPKRAIVREILGSLKTRTQQYKGRGKRMALIGYFVVPVGNDGHLQPGVYWRSSARAIKPMFVFVQQASYRKVLDLPRIANKVIGESFNKQFNAALEHALATAR